MTEDRTIPPKTPTRGRPRTITRDRIAEAGIAIGLPGLTFIGVAARLGVSHMALYKHIDGLDALKTLIAEEIFLRWSLPEPRKDCALEAYLMTLSTSLWQLVARYPGIAAYMLRLDLITPAMLQKIADHQALAAQVYDLRPEQSRWLLFTIAYHCVAVADTVLPDTNPSDDESGHHSENHSGGIHPDYALGVRALIHGAMALVETVTE